ncbi:MAG: hypothetical protein LBL52_02455 [Rickettsiales bacterium]|jgi:hypothetical protein|nr:hypothetical protein [Rickettsiales bacterium]
MRRIEKEILKANKLFCHCCGLPIYKLEWATHDHFPIPKSKGGTSTLFAHYYCDQAHGNTGQRTTSQELANLRDSWKEHGVKAPFTLIQMSIEALEASERLNDWGFTVEDVKVHMDYMWQCRAEELHSIEK